MLTRGNQEMPRHSEKYESFRLPANCYSFSGRNVYFQMSAA